MRMTSDRPATHLSERELDTNARAVAWVLEGCPAPSRIVELFGGTGRVTAAARSRFPGVRIDSWDLDAECCDLIRSKVPDATVTLGSSSDIPLAGGVIADYNLMTLLRFPPEAPRYGDEVEWASITDSSVTKLHLNFRSYGLEGPDLLQYCRRYEGLLPGFHLRRVARTARATEMGLLREPGAVKYIDMRMS